MQATGFGRTICSRVKTEENVENWPLEDGAKVKCPRESSVPGSYISIFLRLFEIFYWKKK